MTTPPTRDVNYFKGLGKLDKIGVCLLGAGVLLIVLYGVLSIILELSYRWLPGIYWLAQITGLLGGILRYIFLAGILFLLVGGGRRRNVVFTVVLFIPRLVWHLIESRTRPAGYERDRYRQEMAAARQVGVQSPEENDSDSLLRQIREEMNRDEFEDLLVKIEQEAKEDGMSMQETEAYISALEDTFEQGLLQREVLEKRRLNRERRRAGLPIEEETEEDRAVMERMQQETRGRLRREEQAAGEAQARAEQAAQERYEYRAAVIEDKDREDERRARREEREERRRNRNR